MSIDSIKLHHNPRKGVVDKLDSRVWLLNSRIKDLLKSITRQHPKPLHNLIRIPLPSLQRMRDPSPDPQLPYYVDNHP